MYIVHRYTEKCKIYLRTSHRDMSPFLSAPINGKNPAEMEIEYYNDPVYEYVSDRCEKLGITVPENYEAIAE